MGLDASVSCNCYRDGRTGPYPFAAPARIDEDGCWELALAWEGHEAEHMQFLEWMKHACSHPRMEAADEHVSNWAGLRAFQQALAHAGADRFPVLTSELPSVNGGQTSAAQAAQMQRELDAFAALASLGHSTWLLDSERGERLHEYIAGYDGVFLLDGRNHVSFGVDPAGFFVRDRQSEQELFRSRAFTQLLLDPEETEHHRDGRVRLVDAARGDTWEGRSAVSGGQIPWPDGRMENDRGQVRLRYPQRLHVEDRPRVPADFAYIVAPLQRLCAAACETGNPIRWG